jgi:hypothetical protein
LTKSVGDSNLEFVEGSYDEENSEGNSECVLVSDDIIEHGFHENSISSQSRAIRSTSENIVGDDHPENLKVNGELQSYKERIDYDSDVPTEHETDRTATKEESGPTISEDSDGQPENLMVDGDLHSYKERIDYDSVVLTENGTDRTAAKEETGPAISEDTDCHQESLMVDGELQSYKKIIDYDSVVPTEHETDRTTAKEVSGPTISEDSNGQPEILAVDGELHSYEERINYDSVVPTKHETDRTTATEEYVPIISEDNQNGDAFTTNKELEDRNLPDAILPLVHCCQYESSESSCRFMALKHNCINRKYMLL